MLAVVLAGCGGAGGSVHGTLSAEIDEFAAKWTMTPTRCVSGEHAGFFGVDLIDGDDQDTLVRVVQDPVEGASVGTNVPGADKAVFLGAGDGCEVFEVEVVRENSRVNNYWNVSGHAVVDCSLDGLELHVDIGFSGCH